MLKANYMFIAGCIENNTIVKIGISKHPWKRILAPEIKKFSKCCVLGAISVMHLNARDIEKHIHYLFRGKRIKGEWFSISDIDYLVLFDLINCYIDVAEYIVVNRGNGSVRDFASLLGYLYNNYNGDIPLDIDKASIWEKRDVNELTQEYIDKLTELIGYCNKKKQALVEVIKRSIVCDKLPHKWNGIDWGEIEKTDKSNQ